MNYADVHDGQLRGLRGLTDSPEDLSEVALNGLETDDLAELAALATEAAEDPNGWGLNGLGKARACTCVRRANKILARRNANARKITRDELYKRGLNKALRSQTVRTRVQAKRPPNVARPNFALDKPMRPFSLAGLDVGLQGLDLGLQGFDPTLQGSGDPAAEAHELMGLGFLKKIGKALKKVGKTIKRNVNTIASVASVAIPGAGAFVGPVLTAVTGKAPRPSSTAPGQSIATIASQNAVKEAQRFANGGQPKPKQAAQLVPLENPDTPRQAAEKKDLKPWLIGGAALLGVLLLSRK
jgi:hypothetical protein